VGGLHQVPLRWPRAGAQVPGRPHPSRGHRQLTYPLDRPRPGPLPLQGLRQRQPPQDHDPRPGLDPQRDALEVAGCARIFEDRASGAKTERPGLEKTLEALRAGDTLVVWRLDRLGRSLSHLITTVGELQERGVGFKSLQEAIDTTSPTGNLVFHIFGAIAEFERNLIRERTQAGLAAARARGRKGGRPQKLDAAKVALLYKLYGEREKTVREICGLLGISKPTLYDYLARRPNARAAAP